MLMALRAFSGRWGVRNACLFTLGVMCGFRISELLVLRICDVARDGRVMPTVTVPRRHMKGRKRGRTVWLNPSAQQAILNQISALRARGRMLPDTPLFLAQSRLFARAMSRVQAWRVLDDVFRECSIAGSTGTHCMRKTFARRTLEYFRAELARGEHIDPMLATMKALGHEDMKSTLAYVSFDEAALKRALLVMSGDFGRAAA